MRPRTGIVKTYQDIEDLLHDCRMSKVELAEALGVHPGTVYQWAGFPPKYALAFLEERKRVLELRKMVYGKGEEK